MEKRKVESLRDLAIAHLPKARKSRAQLTRLRGSTFADIGLQSAYLFDDAESTAVEKQAVELMQLTFMHPNALPMQPYHWDPVEDAELIADSARVLAGTVEIQPQLEAAMLDAARLLCELTGDVMPPWARAAQRTKPMPGTAAQVAAIRGEMRALAAKTGRPRTINTKAEIVRQIVLATEQVAGEKFNPGALPGTAADLLQACQKIEKALTKKNATMATSKETFKEWLRKAGYSFPNGRAPKKQAQFWTHHAPAITGKINAKVFAGVFTDMTQ